MMTTYDMERQAAMPLAAPVGAAAVGSYITAANPLQVHGTFAPSAKPWTTGIHHPARPLGRAST